MCKPWGMETADGAHRNPTWSRVFYTPKAGLRRKYEAHPQRGAEPYPQRETEHIPYKGNCNDMGITAIPWIVVGIPYKGNCNPTY